MANLLDVHATKLKITVRKFGRPVILDDNDGNVYPGLTAIWNDVEHALKIENFEGNPMGNKLSLYFDRDSLQLEGGGEISPANGWKATGAPNAYDPDETYIVEIPKQDKQLPGILLFLSKENDTAGSWPAPGDS